MLLDNKKEVKKATSDDNAEEKATSEEIINESAIASE